MKHLYCYCFFLLSFFSTAQELPEDSFCSRLEGLEETLKLDHYKVPVQDEKFAAVFADYLLEDIDANAYYLTIEDREAVKNLIGPNTLETCKNLNAIKSVYSDALNSTEIHLNALKTEKLDLNKEGSFITSFYPPAVKNSEKKETWRKRILLKSYNRHLSEYSSKDSVADLTSHILDSIKLEVIETELCKLSAIQNESNKLEELILNSYAKSYDPHSSYFSTAQLEDFDDLLSDVTLSFGIDFKKNRKGEIIIAAIAPGSPAWKSNKLNEGDILKYILENGKHHNDFSCFSLNELKNLLKRIDSENPTQFKFTKAGGEVVEVKLTKEEISVSDNIISSFVLKGDKKLGYIYLPSFYSNDDFFSYLPNGCANDLAKELLQLKREGIEGLILDLRNNGGGSMLEAIRLVGSFINYGGISIVDDSQKDLTTLKDLSRGVIYDKPLIVMVNQFSASASELFASAIQDQNRGLVVGTTTFGKSTMQNVRPVQFKGNILTDNFVKITLGAFYRINGATHQNRGVVPDIEIPNIYKDLPIREKSYTNSLVLDSVHKKTYYYPLKKIETENLSRKSAERIKLDSAFQNIYNRNEKLKARFQTSKIPCSYNDYLPFYFSKIEERKKSEAKDFIADKPEYYKNNLLTGKQDEIIAQNIEEIKYDTELNEAYKILIDLIEQTQNK